MTVLTNSNGHPISGSTTDRDAVTSWEPGEFFYNTTLDQWQVNKGASGSASWKPSTGSATGTMPLITINTSVAATGNNQANGNSLSTGFTVVSAADGTKAVVLPSAAAGQVVILKNTVDNVLKVFPASADAVNAGAANAVFNQTNLTCVTYIAIDATTWYTTPLVPS